MRLICGHCGHVNPSGASFCEQCDEYLDWTAMEAPDAAAAPTAQPADRAAQVPRQDTPTQDVAPVASTAVIAEPTRSCPRCATGNPLERRFCRRCGEWLVPAAAVPAAPARPWRSWWQRLVGPLNRADRAAYRRSLSPATRAFRAALLVLLVVALVAVLSPLAGNPVGRVKDEVQSRLGSGRVDRGTFTVTPLPGSRGRNAALGMDALHDNVRDTAWSVEWNRQVAGNLDEEPASCRPLAPPDPRAGFVVTFARPVDVREIGIESGTPDDRASWLPEVVHLTWTPEPTPDQVRQGVPVRPVCRPVTLRQTSDLQRIRVTDGRVRSLRLTVVSSFAPVEAAPGTPQRVRIGELTFWQR